MIAVTVSCLYFFLGDAVALHFRAQVKCNSDSCALAPNSRGFSYARTYEWDGLSSR